MRQAVTQTIEVAGCAVAVWGVAGVLGIHVAAIVAGILLALGAALEARP